MERNRVQMLVEVDLDPIPGAMHTPESAEQVVVAMLQQRIPHYNPTVSLIEQKPYVPTFDFKEIVFTTLSEAEKASYMLRNRIKKFGKVYVGYFYRLVDLRGVYNDDRHGWTDLSEVKLVENNKGWSLDLPKPERL